MAEPAVTTPHHHAGAYHGSNGTPKLVVLHDEEFPLSDTSAEVIARDVFSKANAGGCAQYVIDANSEQHPCAEADISWNAPPNMSTVGIERDGYATWHLKAWRSPKAQMTTCRVAARTAEILARRHLPVRFNEVADLKRDGAYGAKGVTTHNNRSKAFGMSDHSDPGPHFPIAEFMALVRRAYAWFRNHDVIVQFQENHGLKADGVVGERTIAKAARVLYGEGTPAPAKPQPKPVPHPTQPHAHRFRQETDGFPLTLWMSGPRSQRVRDRLGVDDDNLHFDQDLAAAVIQFQRAHGLPRTGKVDKRTWAKMFPKPEPASKAKAFPHLVIDGIAGTGTMKALSRACGLSRPHRSLDKALRKAVQRHLGVDDDGVWGNLTIRTLQAHVGARIDGDLGPETWSHVQRALRDGRF